MVYQTRSERHQRTQDGKSIGMKSIVPMIGVVTFAAPSILAMVPQEVAADDVSFSPDSAQLLIDHIGLSAQEIANQNDLYASVVIAQAILESGNGTSTLSSGPYYNLFGVKSYADEATVWMPTLEFLDGQWVTMDEPFRSYTSYWDSLAHHAALLRSVSQTTGVANYRGVWKSTTTSYQDATAYLTGRYATDPDYANKLNWLIAQYNLTRFDTGTSVAVQDDLQEAPSQAYTQDSQIASAQGGTYTVVQGDTLWDIANTHDISVDQLMAANGLTGEFISVGQQLAI